jgi:hypothetical protein
VNKVYVHYLVFNEYFLIEKMHGKYNVKYSLIFKLIQTQRIFQTVHIFTTLDSDVTETNSKNESRTMLNVAQLRTRNGR